MCGSITLGQVKLGNGVSPGAAELTYTPPPKSSEKGGENNEKEEKTVEEKVTEAVRNAKIAVLEVVLLCVLVVEIQVDFGSS